MAWMPRQQAGQTGLDSGCSSTPLQAALARLVFVLVAAATVLCLGLALARLQQGHGWLDAFVSAVTLAVAALPEEFPVAFTFFLGLGVYRLARRQALVRRAVSVENIGRVTCICSDKTGTITEGRLRVADLLLRLVGVAARHRLRAEHGLECSGRGAVRVLVRAQVDRLSQGGLRARGVGEGGTRGERRAQGAGETSGKHAARQRRSGHPGPPRGS